MFTTEKIVLFWVINIPIDISLVSEDSLSKAACTISSLTISACTNSLLTISACTNSSLAISACTNSSLAITACTNSSLGISACTTSSLTISAWSTIFSIDSVVLIPPALRAGPLQINLFLNVIVNLKTYEWIFV